MSSSQGEPPPLIPHRSYQPTFASGELSPALWWRSDLAKWRSGLALAQNMIVTATGAVARRAGTQYVTMTKGASGGLEIVLPFQFSTEQQYVIEVGNLYMRFILRGAYIMASGVPYEIVTPYAAADLRTIRYVQSADVLTLVHPNYAPMELRRYADTNWTLVDLTVGTALAAPTGVVANAGGGPVPGTPTPATLGFTYAVTASAFASNDESQLSTPATCSNQDLGYYNQYGVLNNITWTAVSGADFYTVYRNYQGVWAKVGSTVNVTFNDINYVPDTTKTPPQATNPFASGNNPGTVGYFQERRVFGGSTTDPETLWLSKSGNYTNFDVSNPSLDDDGITYTLAARQVNQIRHMIPLSDLMIFTGGGGWRLNGQNGAVTPSNFDMAPQTFTGSFTTPPLVIGNRILFVEAKGSSVREIVYQFVQNMYVSEDRSVYSAHLFKGHQIVSWAYAESPDKIVWAVREDGVLLSLTYLIEQDIYAWTEHVSLYGAFKSVVVIAETINGVTEDVAYFTVIRNAPGGTFIAIERMHSRLLGLLNNDVTQAWHVDCGLQYFGSPATVIGGLDFLDGATVSYLADGIPGSAVVASGSITLGGAAARVTVGLAMPSTLTTLPLDGPQPAIDPMMGRYKHGFRARVAYENASGVLATVDGAPTTIFANPQDDATVPEDPPGMFSGVLDTRLAEGWTRDGQLTLSMATPLPATILGIAIEWEAGE